MKKIEQNQLNNLDPQSQAFISWNFDQRRLENEFDK